MSAIETVFKPFTWMPNGDCTIGDNLLEQSRDVAAGASSILELLERDQLSRVDGEPQILSAFHAGNLLRLTIASLHLIVDATDLQIERLNEDREKGASK